MSSPIVRKGKVVGFSDAWFAERKFPVDMAGFAFHTDLLLKTSARMPYRAGHEEDLFLRALGVGFEDIEPKAADCTQVLVWHTQTVSTKVPTVRLDGLRDTTVPQLLADLEQQGVIKLSSGGKKLKVCLKEGCHT